MTLPRIDNVWAKVMSTLPSDHALFEVGTTQKEDLGKIMELADGRVLIYASTTTDISAGYLCQSAASNVANYDILDLDSSSNVALDSTAILVTNGSTAVTENQFAGGMAPVVDTATGLVLTAPLLPQAP